LRLLAPFAVGLCAFASGVGGHGGGNVGLSSSFHMATLVWRAKRGARRPHAKGSWRWRIEPGG